MLSASCALGACALGACALGGPLPPVALCSRPVRVPDPARAPVRRGSHSGLVLSVGPRPLTFWPQSLPTVDLGPQDPAIKSLGATTFGALTGTWGIFGPGKTPPAPCGSTVSSVETLIWRSPWSQHLVERL